MPNLPETTATRNAKAAMSWPAITDRIRVELPPDAWPEWCNIPLPGPRADDRPAPPPPHPGRLDHSPASQWLKAQVRDLRDLGRDRDESLYGLVADALEDVRVAVVLTGAKSVADLLDSSLQLYRGLDLAAVAVPTEERRSRLADLLDEQAQYYLDLSTDLGRLAAWAILQLSAGAEYHTAHSAAEYLDSEAAFREAERAIIDDQFYPSW